MLGNIIQYCNSTWVGKCGTYISNTMKLSITGLTSIFFKQMARPPIAASGFNIKFCPPFMFIFLGFNHKCIFFPVVILPMDASCRIS